MRARRTFARPTPMAVSSSRAWRFARHPSDGSPSVSKAARMSPPRRPRFFRKCTFCCGPSSGPTPPKTDARHTSSGRWSRSGPRRLCRRYFPTAKRTPPAICTAPLIRTSVSALSWSTPTLSLSGSVTASPSWPFRPDSRGRPIPRPRRWMRAAGERFSEKVPWPCLYPYFRGYPLRVMRGPASPDETLTPPHLLTVRRPSSFGPRSPRGWPELALPGCRSPPLLVAFRSPVSPRPFGQVPAPLHWSARCVPLPISRSPNQERRGRHCGSAPALGGTVLAEPGWGSTD